MKKIILCFVLCLMTLSLCMGVSAEQAQQNGEEPQSTAVSGEQKQTETHENADISEETSLRESGGGIGDVLLSVWEEYAAEIFSALTLVGSLAVAFTYKRGLLPTLYGALTTISDTAKHASEKAERLAETAQENIVSLKELTEPVADGMEAVSAYCREMAGKLKTLEETLETEASERALIKTVMAGMADMLWGVFTSANLPEYAKEQIGIRYNAIKGALEGVDRGSQEENTGV